MCFPVLVSNYPSSVGRPLRGSGANGDSVSEVIAITIRVPGSKHAFLGPQLFSGLSYILASFIILELWRVHRRKKLQEQQNRGGDAVEMMES